ncbi:MAG: putative DNA binding domain-containing protein [Rickettsiales bacterium]|nr:putative DNA binding domain-containing protein [Rickettsiales bacterium]MDG4545092.1 putative DNA binding domain-containing protein [Rickettsiales bacterium]MDG4547215.1 putative DNA binding domain-containing protein [Rickettsiales bacterium]
MSNISLPSLRYLIKSFISLPKESEWLEFKEGKCRNDEMGEYISALSNSAALHKKEAGYLIFGIDDSSHNICGTKFKPSQEKVGNQELESWLMNLLTPRIDFTIHEFLFEEKPVVIIEIPPAWHQPVRFKDTSYIRIGSYKKKLQEYPEKERTLWEQSKQIVFEKGLAAKDLTNDDILSLLDYPKYFELTGQNLPENKSRILECLEQEKLIKKSKNKYHITNLGGVLPAKDLNSFDHLSRKSIRVIIYDGNNRVQTTKEQVGKKG